MADEEMDFIPLMEERATVLTERRVTGRVRVSTHTEHMETTLPVDLSDVSVDVSRVPMDRALDEMPEVVTDGDLTIIPVVEERVVVTRQLFLVEEIHIRRTETRETTDIPVTTRKQVATIERLPPDAT